MLQCRAAKMHHIAARALLSPQAVSSAVLQPCHGMLLAVWGEQSRTMTVRDAALYRPACRSQPSPCLLLVHQQKALQQPTESVCITAGSSITGAVQPALTQALAEVGAMRSTLRVLCSSLPPVSGEALVAAAATAAAAVAYA